MIKFKSNWNQKAVMQYRSFVTEGDIALFDWSSYNLKVLTNWHKYYSYQTVSSLWWSIVFRIVINMNKSSISFHKDSKIRLHICKSYGGTLQSFRSKRDNSCISSNISARNHQREHDHLVSNLHTPCKTYFYEKALCRTNK